MRRIALTCGLGLVLAVGFASGSARAESEGLHFSAFASQNYSRTFKDTTSTERGSFDQTLYAVQLTADIRDDLSIRTEVEGEDSGFRDVTLGDPDNTSSLPPEIVVAALQYQPAPAHRFRVGLMRQSMSFYNDYRSISILHPFSALPYLYQPVAGNMEKNFRGVSYQYNRHFDAASLGFIAYGGEMTLYSIFDENGELDPARVSNLAEIIAGGSLTQIRIMPDNLRNMLGGQLEFDQDDSGLMLRAGGFHGWFYDGSKETPWYSWIAGAQWETKWWLLIGEWGRVNDHTESYYGFAGAKLLEGVMATGMLERFYGNHIRTKTNSVFVYRYGVKWDLIPEVSLKADVTWNDIAFIGDKGLDSLGLSASIAAALF